MASGSIWAATSSPIFESLRGQMTPATKAPNKAWNPARSVTQLDRKTKISIVESSLATVSRAVHHRRAGRITASMLKMYASKITNVPSAEASADREMATIQARKDQATTSLRAAHAIATCPSLVALSFWSERIRASTGNAEVLMETAMIKRERQHWRCHGEDVQGLASAKPQDKWNDDAEQTR